jgi:hypothetical protein
MPRKTKLQITKSQILQENVAKKQSVGLTKSELLQIRDDLVNIKGRSRTVEENKLLIQYIAYELLSGSSENEAYRKCEDIFGGSYATYQNTWKNYIENKSLLPDYFARGPTQTKTLYCDVEALSNDVIDKFIQFTWNYNVNNNIGFSRQDIYHYFNEELNIILSENVIDQLLGFYGFEWSNATNYYGIQYFQYHKNSLLRFCYNYSQALQLEQSGTHKIVCSDESWSNTGTSFDHSWQHKCNSKNLEDCYVCQQYVNLSYGDCKSSLCKQNKGKRCIFLHAMTKNQLLVGKDDNGNSLKRLDPNLCINLETTLPTSEFIMECKTSDDDYHKHMNGDIYDKWFVNRLIPSFEQIYPSNKAIFFIDQAPFHINRTKFPNVNSNKECILQYYKDNNIDSITVIRKDGNMKDKPITFGINSFLKNKKTKNALCGGPSKEELLYFLWKYLEKNDPTALEPKIARIARDKGHIVLFGCPNYPQSQPFELFNAHVKLMVKKCNKKGRTIEELYNNILDGMYGGTSAIGRAHKEINQKIIQGWFKKCEENIQNDLTKILNITDKNIYNLWNNLSEFDITKPYIKIPWTEKTINNWKSLFDVVIL